MNTIERYLKSELEKTMRSSFRKQANEILKREGDFVISEDNIKIGFETEYIIKNSHLNPCTEDQRNIIMKTGQNFGKELGASQLEIATNPLNIKETGFLGGLYATKTLEDFATRFFNEHNLSLYRLATDPLVKIENIVRSLQEPKYKLVPNFHNNFRNPWINTELGRLERVNVGDAGVISLASSIQANIQALNFDDAIDKTNRSFMISPYIIAISTNSRFLDQKDTGIEDVRMFAWQVSHDVRTSQQIIEGQETKVGMIHSYLKNMKDYFTRIEKGYFILDKPEAALQIGIGINWKDTRIKFIGDATVVEFRPISIQPSALEDMSVMAFWFGRLMYSSFQHEPLMNIEQVRYNRDEAMINGLDARFIYNAQGQQKIVAAKDILPYELEKAKQGLGEFGLGKESLDLVDILRERIDIGTPSDVFAKKTYDLVSKNVPMHEALIEIVKQYRVG